MRGEGRDGPRSQGQDAVSRPGSAVAQAGPTARGDRKRPADPDRGSSFRRGGSLPADQPFYRSNGLIRTARKRRGSAAPRSPHDGPAARPQPRPGPARWTRMVNPKQLRARAKECEAKAQTADPEVRRWYRNMAAQW